MQECNLLKSTDPSLLAQAALLYNVEQCNMLNTNCYIALAMRSLKPERL